MESFDAILERCNTFAKLSYLKSWINLNQTLMETKMQIKDRMNFSNYDALLCAKLEIEVQILERDMKKMVDLIDNQDAMDESNRKAFEEQMKKKEIEKITKQNTKQNTKLNEKV